MPQVAAPIPRTLGVRGRVAPRMDQGPPRCPHREHSRKAGHEHNAQPGHAGAVGAEQVYERVLVGSGTDTAPGRINARPVTA